jgi:hypothetical protein
MEELIKAFEQTYGLIGLLMAAPALALFYVWKDNRRLEKELQKAGERTVEAYKLRVEDAQKVTDKLTVLMSEQSSLNKETNLVLERISELMAHCRR